MKKNVLFVMSFCIFIIGNFAMAKSDFNDAYKNLLIGFEEPDVGYAPQPLWWWVGEPLDKKRIVWQLDQLKKQGVLNPCVIYSHSPAGFTHGKMPGAEPAPFTEPWWKIWNWTIDECKKRGMTLSFSEYTTFNKAQKKILDEHPQLHSTLLECISQEVKGPNQIEIPIPEKLIHARAYKRIGQDYSQQDSLGLMDHLDGNLIRWIPPEGNWSVFLVYAKSNKDVLDGTNPQVGKLLIDDFYDTFRQRYPDEFGRTFTSFFQDELLIGMNGKPFPLWNDAFIEEFMNRKGYDVAPFLPALWYDIGVKTPKIRMDYYDVAIALIEEAYFIPLYEYMEKHNILQGHDQGARRSVTASTVQYGDYYRTMRWYNAPGNDVYRGHHNFHDTKLSSSIANVYQRSRVWLEAFHTCGWGVTPSQMLAWLNEHYSYGANLYDCHGLYYTTYGGWWEWAPPSAHFRQPYWFNTGVFSKYVSRISYLLSQGAHVCDVAILYPSATMYANVIGKGQHTPQAAKTNAAMWGIAQYLFSKGIDMDYIDYQSLHKASIESGGLSISGMNYHVLIFPETSAITTDSLLKAVELYENGGMVIFYGSVPQNTMEVGKNDPKLKQIYAKLFRENHETLSQNILSSENPAEIKGQCIVSRNSAGGLCVFISDNYKQIEKVINENIRRDFFPNQGNIFVHHRRIDKTDLYFLYNYHDVPATVSAEFRSQGVPEQWDGWSGTVLPFYRYSYEGQISRLKMDFEPHEAKIIVFRKQSSPLEIIEDNFMKIQSVEHTDKSIQVKASSKGCEGNLITLRYNGKTLNGGAKTPVTPEPLELNGLWDFELLPTMDNQWGDFRLPATNTMIGAEARQFKYCETEQSKPPYENCMLVDFDDSKWETATYSFGPAFWKLGPFVKTTNTESIEDKLLLLKRIDEGFSIDESGKKGIFQRYDFSYRWGIENDPVLLSWATGPHGLKQKVPDEFIDLGVNEPGSIWYLWTTVYVNEDTLAQFQLGAAGSAQAWHNGRPIVSIGGNDLIPPTYGYPEVGNKAAAEVLLSKGVNYILLKLMQPAQGRLRAYAVFQRADAKLDINEKTDMQSYLGLRWFSSPQTLFFNMTPQSSNRFGWYRFVAPPNLKQMKFKAYGKKVEIFVDGVGVPLKTKPKPCNTGGGMHYDIKIPKAKPATSIVIVKIELLPGRSGGFAIPEPIDLKCGKGETLLKKWSDIGLATYSGVARYGCDVKLRKEHLGSRVILYLGKVEATAKVVVNGEPANSRYAGPWRFDITESVKTGNNRIEICVANTLANHYSVGIPTPYAPHDSPPVSGLLGPIRIEFQPTVEFKVGIDQ